MCCWIPVTQLLKSNTGNAQILTHANTGSREIRIKYFFSQCYGLATL